MMKYLIAVACAMAFGLFGYSQDKTSGVYLTAFDFENGTLSYSTSIENEENKIRFNEIIQKPFINIKHKGEKIILFKDDIYAYNKKGTIVRTHDFVSYNFLERGVIWIYCRDITTLPGKGVKRERKHYYSVSGNDKILPLTIMNLKKSFPEKYAFHNMLDALFRTDSDLVSYNILERKSQVNHLLETTALISGSGIP